MDRRLECYLSPQLSNTQCIGIIGYGEMGREIKALACAMGVEKVLICDPIAASDEIDELGETFFALWGNGMGGCTSTGEGMETYLPLESLASAQMIIITDVPAYNSSLNGLVTAEFVKKLNPGTSLICLTPNADIIEKKAQNNPRIVYPELCSLNEN